MSERYPGGIISKTPPTVTGPATSGPLAGEGGSASGVWTLADVLTNRKIGIWPTPVLPRRLYGWGGNDFGPLGDGTVANRSSPIQIGALTTWSQASAASTASSVFFKTDGTVWTSGYNPSGGLGQNDRVNRSSPVQVGALTSWSSVSAGGYTVAAIKNDGTLWMWGPNGSGQIGDNTILDRSSPVQVGALTTWSKAYPGGTNSTTALKTDGTLWTWGRNNFGQLGQNIATTISRSSPVQVGALTTWSQAASGTGFNLALQSNGTLWAWGYNYPGQLGDGTIIRRSSPVQIGALTNWLSVSCGNALSGAIKTDGTLWAWGSNQYGGLGTNNVISRSSPVQVGALTTWSKISCGSYRVTAIKTDGTLWNWGYNNVGQLGDNTIADRSSPIQLGALTNWDYVGVTTIFTLAITKG